MVGMFLILVLRRLVVCTGVMVRLCLSVPAL